MQELPFGAKPYLCVSTLIDVTPGRRKSKPPISTHGDGKPAFARQGMRKDPKQQSTCRGILYVVASLLSAGILSTTP